jgi:hypothetical protein
MIDNAQLSFTFHAESKPLLAELERFGPKPRTHAASSGKYAVGVYPNHYSGS